MPPRSSPQKKSQRTSPRKDSQPATSEGDSKPPAPTPSLKIRLKAPGSGSLASSTDSATSAATAASEKQPMKIKLTLSKSSSAEGPAQPEAAVPAVGQKRRGRPRRDPQAIKEAAVAAATPNETEIQERKIRRQATEEKIRKSVSMEGIVTGAPEDSDANERQKKRSRMSKSFSSDYVDIVGGRRDLASMPASMSSSTSSMPSAAAAASSSASAAPLPPTFSVNPNENEFVQRSKNILNVALQQDQGSVQTPVLTPFTSLTDAVERLLPYHLALNAGQYEEDVSLQPLDQDNLESSYQNLVARFKTIIHNQHSKPVSTELLLLEQRLCLEEEKFLLQKMKNDYNARYMALASQASSRPATPKQ